MGVTLPKSARFLPTFEQQTRGEGREGDVSLFHVYAGFAEERKAVGAGSKIR